MIGDIFTLDELNKRVRQSIEQSMPNEYWVKAELSDVRINNGHCYLEFIQSDKRNHQLIAKARGIIWSSVFKILRPYFEETTHQPFDSGIKVLVRVSIQFHELYGYSLTVHDIDPTYTIGDKDRRRREILLQLEKEGVLTLNKELPLPMLIQRIAVISSATAAGYEDFKHQLDNNPNCYAFSTQLFPAIMQGAQVENSVLQALDDINSRINEFDVVVIIRGGGATSDLSGFDTYLLAAACAQFSLPIIVGIGHERDETLLDHVAAIRVKTPTAAAEYLIGHNENAALYLNELSKKIQEKTVQLLTREYNRLHILKNRIPALVTKQINDSKIRLILSHNNLKTSIKSSLSFQQNNLNMIRQRLYDISPDRILSKGYSITFANGKILTDVTQIHKNDIITTQLTNGVITSIVTDNNK